MNTREYSSLLNKYINFFFMNSINIIVDDREPDNAVLIHLQAIPESCVVIKRLPIGDYQFSDKVIFERKTIKDFAKSIIEGIRKLQLHILQGLPGIGPLRAKKLLEKFGSIVAVMNASATDLQKVEGIGEKAAARIAWILKENITNDNISSETNFT